MLVIGIDPGLTVTGYGILDQTDNTIRVRDYGTIRPPGGPALAERLLFLYEKMVTLIQVHQPDVLAIENTFHSNNVKSALLLGQARGVLLLAGATSGIPCAEYAPRKVKQSVTGTGIATKEQVQYMVKSILGLDQAPTPLDSSDALAVALCHLHQPRWKTS